MVESLRRRTPDRAPPARARAGARTAIALAGLLLLGCQAIADSTAHGGIGASCRADDECQASHCTAGVCTIACSNNDTCPSPTFCAGGTCQLPMRAGFLHAFDPTVQQSTRAQEAGRTAVQKALPYLTTEAISNKSTAGDAANAAKQLAAKDHVVIVDEPTYGDIIAQTADALPGTVFVTCGARNVGDTFGSYYGRMYQAFYLAGFAAGSQTTKKRLGVVGSYVTPNVVQAINAFALGARSVDPTIKVEIRWVGFWHDQNPPDVQGKSLEVVDTERLAASGCDVIADTTDGNYVVARVASTTGALTGVKSIGYNVPDACGGATSCLGASYWNWGPLFTSMLSDIHASGIADGARYEGGLAVDPNDSVVGFAVNAPKGAPMELASKVSSMLGQLVNDDERFPFKGPICSTGQRTDCLADGALIDWDELFNMCWFVDGMVEKMDPTDPLSADVPAQVPNESDCKPMGG